MKRLIVGALLFVLAPVLVLVAPAAHAATHRVTYNVWSEVTPLTVAAIGYNDHDGSRVGAINAPLPWSRDVTWTDETKHPVININGYSNGQESRIYCQILIDGQVVDEGDRVEGATCSYNLDGVRRRHCLLGGHGQVVGDADRVAGDPCSLATDGPPGS